jgi:hypothetical protein
MRKRPKPLGYFATLSRWKIQLWKISRRSYTRWQWQVAGIALHTEIQVKQKELAEQASQRELQTQREEHAEAINVKDSRQASVLKVLREEHAKATYK